MNKVKFTIKFRLEQRKDKNGLVISENVPINANITFCGKRLCYYTGYRINAAQWNDKDSEVKRNNFNKSGVSASDINSRLRQIRTALDNVFTRLAANEIIPTPNNVRDMLKAELDETPISRKSFMDYYEEYLKNAGTIRQWSVGTIKIYNTLRNHLNGYQHTTFYFEDINKTFLNGFVTYLITNGIRNEVISKYLKTLKAFMNWASDEGYNKTTDYLHFKPILKTTSDKIHKFALTLEEFQTIFTMDIDKVYLRRVRDVFCFCCGTGMRYSDAKALRWSDIKDGYIDFTSQKTMEHSQIPLNHIASTILERYAESRDVNEHVLPVISNQKYNLFLKELGKLAGMTQIEHEVYFVGGERLEETYQRWE